MEEQNKIQSCIKLVRRLPCSRMDENITAITNLIYEDDDLLNEFLQKVDNRIEICKKDGEFLRCEHNRDGDSYRSPHSNKYFPAIDDGRYPTKEVRELEIKLNKMFQIYARSYYSGSTITSSYCWNLGEKTEDGFGVSILIKNIVNLEKEVNSGVWDSNNVINVTFTNEGDKLKALYKLTTSVTLHMSFDHKICGKVNLSGSVSRQVNFSSLKILGSSNSHY
jgi:capping protein beta